MAGSKGEGSRGGKIIGHTKSGRAKYAVSGVAIASGAAIAHVATTTIRKKKKISGIWKMMHSSHPFAEPRIHSINSTISRLGKEVKIAKGARIAGAALIVGGIANSLRKK